MKPMTQAEAEAAPLIGMCQHTRWFTLPSGKEGHIACGEPALKDQTTFMGGFMFVEYWCDKHNEEE